MKNDRASRPPRGKPPSVASRGGPRKPGRSFGDTGARKPSRAFGEPGARRPPPARPPRERTDTADPYKPARRPARDFTARGDNEARFPRGERSRFADRASSERSERPARGFTVTLDPDIARVFRGDASVNRALRLVLQLMQVVQGPPQQIRDRTPRGYQGTPEARGFTRRPRFEDENEAAEESNE